MCVCVCVCVWRRSVGHSSRWLSRAPGELDHSTRLRATKFPDFHSAYAARCKELGIKPHPKVVGAMDVPEGEDARDIEFLVLAGIHLSRRDVKALCWSLSCHRTLLHLDLSSIPLGEDALCCAPRLCLWLNRGNMLCGVQVTLGSRRLARCFDHERAHSKN